MSYYEDGLGQFNMISGGVPLVGGLSVSKPAATTTQALVNVGIPPTLVKLYGDYLWNLGMTMGMSDANRPVIMLVGGVLKSPRLNTFGLVDPVVTSKQLMSIPADTRAWLEQPNAPSIARLLNDIAAGKYAGSAPTMQISPVLRSGLTLNAATAATAALKSQVAATTAAAAQTKQATADQAAATAQQTQAPADQAAAQQAQAAADQATQQAQAAAQDAANAAIQVAAPGDPTLVGPADLVAPTEATPAPATAAPAAGGAGGIPWMYIGIGAAGLAVVGYLVMGRGSATPNRRRAKKNRRHSKRTRRARKA